MNTCKDCLCYNACNYHIDEETTMTVEECSTGFMNKAEYVKLPIFVGRPVWFVRHWHFSNEVEIKCGKVSMLQQKADGSWKFRVSEGGYVCDHLLSDLGKIIFLSESEAQEAKKRLENNNENC